jgi:hypothetical protein
VRGTRYRARYGEIEHCLPANARCRGARDPAATRSNLLAKYDWREKRHTLCCLELKRYSIGRMLGAAHMYLQNSDAVGSTSHLRTFERHIHFPKCNDRYESDAPARKVDTVSLFRDTRACDASGNSATNH